MKSAITGLAAAAVAMTAAAETIRFDADPVGAIPAGWTCGVTGRGNPQWAVQPDASLSPPTRVLIQSGSGTFPWCVRTGASVADGFVEVKFRPISGREDQAGGVVWRWKDGDNYYVARANALENNVSLYYTEHGNRRTLKYVDAPVARGAWHTLRVDFAGSAIAVSLDGKRYIEHRDAHIAGSGAVGVWTKADSVTAFTDFGYGSSTR
jgi:FtsP/CotA-like multicopper oxidase with cupredoxin domain